MKFRKRNILSSVEIKEGIRIEFIEYDGHFGKVYNRCYIIYNDKEKINFGEILILAYGYTPSYIGGYYKYDDNYVYKCFINDEIESIFDLNNKIIIEDKDEMERIYDEYLNRNASSLAFIRNRNMVNNHNF